MIIAKIEDFKQYFPQKAMELAYDFLISLDEGMEEREYELVGRDMFARIMSYETRGPQNAVLESHIKYMDIQTTIAGAECIAWWHTSALEIDTPYHEGKDVTFYEKTAPQSDNPIQPSARVDVYPGTFVALFPEDAHMPQLMLGTGGVSTIKKVVIKVSLNLISA